MRRAQVTSRAVLAVTSDVDASLASRAKRDARFATEALAIELARSLGCSAEIHAELAATIDLLSAAGEPMEIEPAAFMAILIDADRLEPVIDLADAADASDRDDDAAHVDPVGLEVTISRG